MILPKDFLNKLKEFGINSYEAKLWAALLSCGISTAGELSDIANVPRSRSYDVLESLEKKGFIITKLGKPIKFIAVPPDEVIDRVKKRIVQDANEQSKMVDEFKTSGFIHKLNDLFKQGIVAVDPADMSGSMKGRKNIYNQIESTIKNAKKSIIIVTTTNGIIRKNDTLINTFKKAKQRGVQIRIAAPLNAETAKEITELKKYAEIKHTDVDARFCVVDGTQVIFTVAGDNETNPQNDTGIWISSPYFGSTLQNFFDTLWK